MGPIKLSLYLLYIYSGFNDQKMEKLKEQIQSVIDIYKSGNLSRAEQITKKLINDNPKVAFLYNFLGLILVDQKKLTRLYPVTKKALK